MTNTSSGRYTVDYAGRDAATSVSDAAVRLAGVAGEKVDSAIETAEQAARRVSAQANEAGECVKEVAGNMRQAVDKSLNEQPMTTLLMAAAVGFVLGALWKS